MAACSAYVASACLLFGTTALYHRGDWGPRGEVVLRRLDHADIFLIIAGTYTPGAVVYALKRPGPWPRWFSRPRLVSGAVSRLVVAVARNAPHFLCAVGISGTATGEKVGFLVDAFAGAPRNSKLPLRLVAHPVIL